MSTTVSSVVLNYNPCLAPSAFGSGNAPLGTGNLARERLMPDMRDGARLLRFASVFKGEC